MKDSDGLVSLRDFFLRCPSLGAPFVNLLRSDGVSLDDPEMTTPVIIASDLFISHMQTRSRNPIKYRGYPSFIYISGLGEKKELAQCFGRMNRVLIYRIPSNYNFSGIGGVSALLCNLSVNAVKHWEVKVNISKSRGPIRAYLNHLASYINCEETYVDKT
jgi:hypothetical protein